MKQKSYSLRKTSLLLLGLVIIYLILSKYLNIYIFCPFHKLTGFYCPGCGVTRMLFSLLTLDFYQAFRYNCLLFISLPFFLFFYINALLYPKKPLYQKIPSKIWYLIIIIFLIYGLLRNIPFFDFLAPTIIT